MLSEELLEELSGDVCQGSSETGNSLHAQASTGRRQALTMSLGLGGLLHMLCLPAIASTPLSKVQSSKVQSSEIQPSKTQASETQASDEIATTTKSDASETGGNKPSLSAGSLSFEPTLSRPRGRKQVSKSIPNPTKPWSVASLTDVQNLELAWGDVSSTSAGGWMVHSEVATAAPEVTENPAPENSVLEEPVEPVLEESVPEESVLEESVLVDDLRQNAPVPDAPELFLSIESDDMLGAAVPAEVGANSGAIADSEENNESVEADVAQVVTQVVTVEADIAEADIAQANTEETAGEAKEEHERDLLSELLADEGAVAQEWPLLDEELGTLRLIQLRSRENEELGILRLMQTAEATPPAPPKVRSPIATLGGRLGYVNVENVFRSTERIQEQVYQTGLSLYLFPKLSENTSLYAIADANIARYNTFSDISNPDSRGIRLDYNELQVQAGIRQRLRPRTFAQLGWRNQQLYSPGYREKLFGVNYIDALVSHRSILSPKVWVDSFYQMRLGFADPQEASRFRQTVTLSLNYGVTRDLRTSLIYQLDFDDYTQINRYDTYQQLLGIVSYNITPESRISVFGGTRFGESSAPNIDLDDTFYGAGLNVNIPLF